MPHIMRLPAVALLVLAWIPPANGQADLVVHNAVIYTVDDGRPQADAMAIRNGRILLVGSEVQVLGAYPGARRLDAEGQAIVPGMIDAHAHLMGMGLGLFRADLVGAASRVEVVERLRAAAERLPEETWLLGRGWDQNDWPDTRFPTRQDLDAAFPDRPVWLTRIDGHAAWANTAALNEVGLEVLAAMADPEGGKILRDAQGTPTGLFVDAAMSIIGARVPPPSAEEQEQALRAALQETARYGLTSVHEAGASLGELRLYQRAADEGWFDLRLYAMVGGAGRAFEHFCEAGLLYDYRDRLTVRSVKFYIDGALGSRGAALLDDYHDDPGNRGLLMVAPDSFRVAVERAMRCGYQVNTHAIGDAGNRVVLDAYAGALQAVGLTAGRHRVEHAQVMALEDIPRFADLGLVASMQPTHATSDMYWAEDRLGPDRIRGAYAWQRFREAGVRLAFGSDFPVEGVNPLLGFYAAVTRQDADAWPEGGWYADQRVDRAEALRAFTLGAAYAAFQEHAIGSLTPGKWADFVILDRDIMQVPPGDILETQVVATYIAGEPVYER